MKNKKIFYKQVNFYVMVAAILFTIIALCLYAGNCASEFNGGVVSSSVVGWALAAVVCSVIAVAAGVTESLLPDSFLVRGLAYARFLKYAAFVSLIVSFLRGILDEYSLLGTILYPIVSGTVGDPVDSVLSVSYFASLICLFVAIVLSIVSALIQKGAYYRAERVENNIQGA